MRTYKLDWSIVIVVLCLSILSIVTLFGGGGESFLVKRISIILVGFILMLLLRFINYQFYYNYASIFYIFSIILLLFTLFPFIGSKIKGARSWIRFGIIGFQPTELAKLSLIFMISKYLASPQVKQLNTLKDLSIPFILTGIPLILIALQPDLGYAILMIPIVFFMLFVAGANVSLLLSLFFLGFIIIFLPLYLEYHRYILVDNIYHYLENHHFQLANAVRVLKFDIWQYVDRPELASIYKVPENIKWAVDTITEKNNLDIINQTLEILQKENPNLLRDFLNNSLLFFISIVILFICYLTHLLSKLLWGITYMAGAGNICMVLAISLSMSMLFHKITHFKSHQIIRIVAFANPDKFPKGAGYQLRHSLITLGSGKLFGKGIAQGDMTRGKVPFLPEWHNDFIFPVIGEQFGLVGTIFTLFLLFLLIIRGTLIASQSKDKFGSLLGMGITIMFLTHFGVSIGITLGLLPVTGIPLSFISTGGSNTLTSFISIGILLNIHARKFINT